MAEISEKLEAEFERIDAAVEQLAAIEDPSALSALELAGCGAMLQSLYNGFENVLKQAMLARQEQVPSGPSWHRDLLAKAVESGLLSVQLGTRLQPYAAFRHFFTHSYGVQLDAERMAPLIAGTPAVAETFKANLTEALRGGKPGSS